MDYDEGTSVMKEIKLVVTDLDDTIWNWFEVWYVSFNNYFNRIANELDINPDILKKDFQALHKKYGSSEFSFAYKELKCINPRKYKSIDNNKSGLTILHQYYHDKKNTLHMFPTVHDTLAKIKASGAKIVGFTESNSFFTKTRIKHLGLDGMFDFIYCPQDVGLPRTTKRFYEKGYYEPVITKIINLPSGIKKPNSEVLLRIISDLGIESDKTIYIGDKLDRDVSMANSLGVISCYAQYGDLKDDERYVLLREVSHWTETEINREKEIKSTHNLNLKPAVILEKFDDLFKHFSFSKADGIYTENQITHLISLWNTTVEVQKHFNDIELRIRSMAVTIFTFLIAGIGYAQKENISVTIGKYNINGSVLISIIALLIFSSLYLMDKHWYHRFLHSAVKQGMELEGEIEKQYVNLKLTKEIKIDSPLNTIFKTLNIHSDQKISIFYALFVLPFIFILVCGIFRWL